MKNKQEARQEVPNRKRPPWPILVAAVVGCLLGTAVWWWFQPEEHQAANEREAPRARSSEWRKRHLQQFDGKFAADSDDQPETPMTAASGKARVVIGNVGLLDSFEFHERDPQEFQGRRLPKIGPICESSETCGMASACIDGTCGPCTRDDDCVKGEVCVLQNCLTAANVSCRSRKDCPENEHCIFNEPRTRGAMNTRGNLDLKSFCNDMMKGLEQRIEDVEPTTYPDAGIFHGSELDHTTKMLRNLGAE